MLLSVGLKMLPAMRCFLRDELRNAAAADSMLERVPISKASTSNLAMIATPPWELQGVPPFATNL